MVRFLVALSGLVVVASVVAAPVPTHLFPKPPLPYFPTTIGTKWVYEEDNQDLRFVISKAEQTDRGTEVTVEQTIGEMSRPFQTLVVSATGLVQTHLWGQKLAHPWVLLKVPNKTGDTWNDADSEEFKFRLSSNKVGGMETVEVPAGTFQAIRVDAEYDIQGLKQQKHCFWYAREVGVVKIAGNENRVLKSFTPGKK